MPTRTKAASGPPRQSVRRVDTVAVIHLLGALAFDVPDGASFRRCDHAALAPTFFVAASIAHRRLRRIRWR